MKIREQLRRIFKAAPYLPIQSVASISLLIGIGFMIYNIMDKISTNWKMSTAEPIQLSSIQERIRNKEKEYFYKVNYEYSANYQSYSIYQEKGFKTYGEAKKGAENDMKFQIPLWYSEKNPLKYHLEEYQTYWQPYFIGLIIFILFLSYFRWLFLKYYELELLDS